MIRILLFCLFVICAHTVFSQEDIPTSINDSITVADFHEYRFKIALSTPDSINTLLRDSTYRLMFSATCPYSEYYPQIDNHQLKLSQNLNFGCSEKLLKENQVVRISSIGYPIQSATNDTINFLYRYSFKYEGKPSLFFDTNECELRSYNSGEYIILTKSIIFQHGGQTSYGQTMTYYLRHE